ncbi:hypothetical protein MNV49_005027 [Pseudohyphozyma bogoriensis]|nr:hypothetical protein MNV49_005027 [Pseudohyphozyma bogoriensis]
MSTIEEIIEQDLDLLICSTCGAQFSAGTPESHICEICADDRQWVPLDGQIWTTLRKLRDSGRKIDFVPDRVDPEGLTWLVTTPPIAIQQSPLLVKTPSGWLIVECCPFISPEAVHKIKAMVMESGLPFLGIALSHPHWYNSGAIWARALECKIYASKLDKEWWMRKETVDEVVEWFETPTLKLGDHATMILCGGHFPGSCVTHIEREGRGGLLCVADTLMLGWSSVIRQVSYMYSYPNFIPLPPNEIVHIWNCIKDYSFDDAYGAWIIRRIVGGAKKEVYDQLGPFLAKMGAKIEDYDVAPFKE